MNFSPLMPRISRGVLDDTLMSGDIRGEHKVFAFGGHLLSQ
jgi:hypothetical protein